MIGIVDLFSGPGGLGEGFSRVRDQDGSHVFEIDLSVEKDPVAHATLKLRAFLRKFGDDHPPEYVEFLNAGGKSEPVWAELYPEQWQAAEREALNLTLGDETAMEVLSKRLEEIRAGRGDNTVLIGGPPCQAYSLAGRGRKPSDLGYVPHEENRHRLYEEYIKVLSALRPAAFVMENVKGMLSSSIENRKVFDLVTRDLKSGGGAGEYLLTPLSGDLSIDDSAPPRSFVVEAERHGVPQARHRVILTGIRRDLFDAAPAVELPHLAPAERTSTVRDVLSLMPGLRSGISARGGNKDNTEVWKDVVSDSARRLLEQDNPKGGASKRKYRSALGKVSSSAQINASRRDGAPGGTSLPNSCPTELAQWIRDNRLERLVQHETRSHMKSDLGRYLFASAWTHATGVSPKAKDFPDSLAPNHGNWKSGKFNDRFRAQPWDKPSSTVTCHLSKDGHYFIHPDFCQCRSLTVREAARLQTFPDNYFFKGNRTEQYIQVGNAVPPFLAWQIAEALAGTLQAILAEPVAAVDAAEKMTVPA